MQKTKQPSCGRGEVMATEQDHTWGILDDMLVFLAGQGVPTPERTYKFDGGWALAMSDLRRYTATLTSERDQLRAELAAAREHAEYQDKEVRLWAAAVNIGTWPLSEKDTKNTGFYGRLAAKMTTERNSAAARAEAAEAHAARLRRALEEVLNSAYPHPTEHPTMTAAWEVGRSALAETPDQSVQLVQAEALRETAARAEYNETAGYYLIGREQLLLWADRLEKEAENGR